ncbi:MAG TPA: lipid II flippase Amj family protein [Desulfitobacteriaceae bacterium]|nr:lipid II flippase Amj family protein [Desulfitobacteriaceae bacterium]
MEFSIYQLYILTFIIHIIDTFAYSVRLNYVKSRQFALSMTFFNLFYLISLIAHTLQAPLIGGLIDCSIKLSIDPLPDLRKVILAATAGTFFGIILTPTFLNNFFSAVTRLERTGSVPSIVIDALKFRSILRFIESITLPSRKMVNRLPYHKIPLELIVLNVLVTGIYTIGVMSAYYAASLVAAQHRLAASASAGIINTTANIIFMLFIDPKSSIITDQTLRGNRPYEDVKALVVFLMGAKLIGTIFGQVLLIPVAQVIARLYQ